MPSSPPPISPKTAPLPPSTTIPVVSPTRATFRPPPPAAEAGPSTRRPSRGGLTSAEAYANAHYPSRHVREREKSTPGHTAHTHAHGATVHKPIFDWISRKLGGAGRRATVTEFGPSRGATGNENARVRYPSLPKTARAENTRGPVTPTEMSTFTRHTSNSISRSESLSLHSYSFSPVSERRREANNPYPSIPVPLLQNRDRPESTIDISYISRSRTPSLRSEGSLTSSFRPRISFADDGSSFRLAGRVADEDASVRPLPPSQRASPTPSASRSASASLLSPQPSRRPTSPSLKTRDTGSIGGDRSFVSSEPEEGRQSRRDSSRRDSSSTKPTTIVSFEAPPAHIAQAASPGGHQVPPSPLRGSISRDQGETDPAPITPIPPSLTQAPKHSHPHPRDNPRPSSPPDPNASTLTLASSTFAIPGGSWTPNAPSLYNRPSSINQLQIPSSTTPNPYGPPFSGTSPISTPLNGPTATTYRPPSLATSPSVTWAPGPDRNSIAEYPPSLHPTLGTSFRTGGWAGSRGAADRDASVRAVRRKGSWESNESGWSWRGANGGVITPVGGTSSPGFISPPPPLLQHHSSQGSGILSPSGGLVERTPRLSQLAPPFDLTLPIDMTDDHPGLQYPTSPPPDDPGAHGRPSIRSPADEESGTRGQLRIDTGIPA